MKTENDGAGARKPEVCPSCGATDNNPYTDANGNAMRACGRCMIQWRVAERGEVGSVPDTDEEMTSEELAQRFKALFKPCEEEDMEVGSVGQGERAGDEWITPEKVGSGEIGRRIQHFYEDDEKAEAQPEAGAVTQTKGIENIRDRCEANVISFSNDDVSELLVEIDRLRLATERKAGR
jgi:hypothetical protein